MARDKAKQAEYMREWTARNRERINAERKTRRAKNPEKRKVAQNAWYGKNKDKLRERARLRYLTEAGELIRQQSREWAKANPEKKKDADRRRYRNRRLEACLWLAARRAKKRGVPFMITKDDIKVPELCPYLNVPFAAEGDYVPTMDCIEPHLGYVPGNVVMVTKRANRIKNNATWKELITIGNALENIVNRGRTSTTVAPEPNPANAC